MTTFGDGNLGLCDQPGSPLLLSAPVRMVIQPRPDDGGAAGARARAARAPALAVAALALDVKVIFTPPCLFCIENP
jgi:hypothetical protein